MIKYDSNTHTLLKVAKIMREPFSPEDAIHVIPKLDKPSRVKESARVLVKGGFLEEHPDGRYMITQTGKEELFAIVARTARQRMHPPDDDDL